MLKNTTAKRYKILLFKSSHLLLLIKINNYSAKFISENTIKILLITVFVLTSHNSYTQQITGDSTLEMVSISVTVIVAGNKNI